jgi:hypothetical protein
MTSTGAKNSLPNFGSIQNKYFPGFEAFEVQILKYVQK